MIVSLIAAFGKNRELGLENKLLWNLRDDLKNFKKLTSGHHIIMGRKTFESIGNPLPKRTNVVVTRNKDWSSKGVVVAGCLEDALLIAKDGSESEVFICGGGQIYKEAIEKDLVDKMYLSQVEWEGEADTFFPEINSSGWQSKASETYDVTNDNPLKWKLEVLERVK